MTPQTQLVLALVHLVVTSFMTGLIWFVQVVHYPLYGRVGEASFADYEREHIPRTGRVVGPAMLLEAVTTALLLFAAEAPRALTIAGAALLALIWLSTFIVQAPTHHRLRHGHDAALIQRLVVSNWARTFLWSARALVAALIVLQMAGAG